MTFEELNLQPDLMKAIQEAGYTEPSPIQKDAIPIVLEGRDIIAQAQTGTGKTAAFGLPALNMLTMNDGVEVLIITPTRELCTQVSDEIFKLGRFMGVKTVAVYGGQSIGRQVDFIERGAQVVVATPGRMLDHLKNGRLSNFMPKIVILDEADEMLDMGFLDDIEEIFSFLPLNRQTLLFSATMPEAIKKLALKILHNPATVKIEKKEVTNENIEQMYYVMEERERQDALVRLIDAEVPTKAVIFARTKRDADELSSTLLAKGYSTKPLHGDMDQRQREEAIKSFRASKIDILVATDVAARGLDISDVSHVFNYHIPLDPESYVHRIGRTGRAGKKGKAITLINPLEFKELNRITHLTKAQMYHAEIPTIEQVQRQHYDKLLEKIKEQAIHDDAAELMEMIGDDIDSATLVLKLISKILSKKAITGPNKIGITAERVAKMLENSKTRGGNDRGGFRGRGHGGGGGGRGGYRGGGQGGGRSYGDRDRGGSGGGYRGDRPSGDRPAGDRRPSGDRPAGDRRPSGDRPSGGGYRGGNSGGSYGDRPSGDRPSRNRY